MLRLPLRRLAAILLGTTLFLTLAGLTAESSRFLFGHARWLGLLPLFDSGEESNLPTWWQSLLFALSALAALALASRTAPGARPAAWRWRALAAWMLLLSLAEGAAFDQRFGPLLAALRHRGAFGPAGVPALLLAVAALAAVCFVPLVRPLRGSGLVLACAGVIWVAGAVGMQWAEGAYLRQHAVESAGFVLLHGAEEFGESLGVALALLALLARHARHGGVRVAMR